MLHQFFLGIMSIPKIPNVVKYEPKAQKSLKKRFWQKAFLGTAKRFQKQSQSRLPVPLWEQVQLKAVLHSLDCLGVKAIINAINFFGGRYYG